jgi:type I restriction enzyme, S subunit
LSRIGDLIAELCPHGVAYSRVGDVTAVVPTARGIKRQDYALGTIVPIVDQGQSLIAGYTDDSSLALPKGEYIVFGDHTRALKWVDFSFATGADGTKVLRAAEGIESKYAFYAIDNLEIPSRGYNRHWAVLRELRIPLPPRKVQREIVRILDTFSALEEELEALLDAEAKARPTQQACIRSRVLRLEPSSIIGSVPLSEVVEFINGKPQERLVIPDGTVALLTARFISTAGKSARWVNPESALTPARRGDIAMVMSDLPNGRALARCYYVEEDGKYSANQRVCLLRVRDETTTLARYLYHFLDRNPQLLAFDNGQDQTHLKKGQILDIRVPTIPFPDQERAALVLGRLGASTRELVAALGVEQEARRCQFEHYRDRMLTFDEAAA